MKMIIKTTKENFFKTSYNTIRGIAEKRTNALVKEAQKLIQDIQNGEKSAAAGGKKIKKCPLIGGAIGLETTSTPNAPPKKKKAGNPLKKELSNPQGLDFANQAGALMAQPQIVEMMPRKDNPCTLSGHCRQSGLSNVPDHSKW